MAGCIVAQCGWDALKTMVVVSAPADIQRARVLERGTMTEAQFETILAKQMPDAQKRALADHVIETLTLEGARTRVAQVIAALREAKANA